MIFPVEIELFSEVYHRELEVRIEYALNSVHRPELQSIVHKLTKQDIFERYSYTNLLEFRHPSITIVLL